MGSAQIKSRQMASELPSFGSMDFKDKTRLSRIQTLSLDKPLPDFERCDRLYWRNRFIQFVRKEYRKMNKVMPKIVKSEEKFLKDEPTLVNKWEAYKAKEWFKKGNQQFLMGKTGLKAVPHERQDIRAESLDYFLKVIFWCPHWECWKRIKHLPLLPFYFMKFLNYWKRHPELLDTH